MDSGTQINAISHTLAKEWNLPIYQLQRLVNLEGFSGATLPYITYTKVQIEIPQVKSFIKFLHVFIQPDTQYANEGIPIMLGTPAIDQILKEATPEEIDELVATSS